MWFFFARWRFEKKLFSVQILEVRRSTDDISTCIKKRTRKDLLYFVFGVIWKMDNKNEHFRYIMLFFILKR